MKKLSVISLLIILLISACEVTVSEKQAETFIKYYGSYAFDEGKEVELLDNGGYALCGTASISPSETRMVLIITDRFGNMLDGFPLYYTLENRNSGANSLVAINGGQNGFLLCGYIRNPGRTSSNTQEDIFVVRTSSKGVQLWSRSFGSAVEDEAVLHVAEGISSGFMLAGYQEKGGEKDIMIMGMTSEGDSIPLSLNYNKPVNSSDAVASYILNAGDHYLCACTYDKVGSDGNDILVLNFDDEMSPNDRILGGEFDESAKCIVKDTENRYFILGEQFNPFTNHNEIILHFIETDGLLVRNSGLVATIDGNDSDLYAERFVKKTTGELVIVGTRTIGNNDDILLQFMDGDQVTDELFLGAEGSQRGNDIGILPDNKLIILGTNGYESNSMISLIKTDESGNL